MVVKEMSLTRGWQSGTTSGHRYSADCGRTVSTSHVPGVYPRGPAWSTVHSWAVASPKCILVAAPPMRPRLVTLVVQEVLRHEL